MPILVFFVFCLIVLWLGILLGSLIHHSRETLMGSENKVIDVLEGALLTLFGLLIGFTFSMAVSRYDARKVHVVQEANAIGTTWLRTSLLPEPVRTQEQDLLREYVQQRLEYHAGEESRHNEEQAELLRGRLWAVASSFAMDHREAVTNQYMQSLNNTIDAAVERIEADENRIPVEAWWMLLFVGFIASAVMGTKISPRRVALQLILPVVLAATMTMTMDLDRPRHGLIRITQTDMERVANGMKRLPQQMP